MCIHYSKVEMITFFIFMSISTVFNYFSLSNVFMFVCDPLHMIIHSSNNKCTIGNFIADAIQNFPKSLNRLFLNQKSVTTIDS